MRSHLLTLVMQALIFVFLVSCTTTPGQVPVSASVPTNTPYLIPTNISKSPPQREPLLRIAILGDITTTNVWKMFDESGVDYWNYATQIAYWPSLYHLTPPSLDLQPATAQGMPSPLKCDPSYCSATVTLQPNLKWTDGSPYTADDVAFTVNTALQFRLSLNWMQAYNPDVLDHAEALDRYTVRFYFTRMPTVGEWYYGVLQGPIVSQSYWRPRIADAATLLPEESLRVTVHQLELELADLQARVGTLYSLLDTMAPASDSYQNTKNSADSLQNELNFVANQTDKARTEYETRLAEARAALFLLTNDDEPVLGAWVFAKQGRNTFENLAILGTPFGDPWFDRVQYITFESESDAVEAMQNDAVDIMLTPDGLSSPSVVRLEGDPAITLAHNLTRSARFLAFNEANPYLNDPALRQALACMLDPQALNKVFEGEAASLADFVLSEFWHADEVTLPCTGLNRNARLRQSVTILKDAGFSWIREPTPNDAGSGLGNPAGSPFPVLTLLTINNDPLRVQAAFYIAEQMQTLGAPVDVKQTDYDDLMYSVYGSRDYDMAILGWRLSAYPSYLCDWFMPVEQNPFVYNGSRLISVCEAWSQTGELEAAKLHVKEIQSILMQDFPLIPLYVHVRTDAYRNIHYPFGEVLDGLAGLYGAPIYAVPNP